MQIPKIPISYDLKQTNELYDAGPVPEDRFLEVPLTSEEAAIHRDTRHGAGSVIRKNFYFQLLSRIII